MERSADWIEQARSDLEHARHDLAGAYFEWACFSAQQAAEKAVKAVFQKLGSEAWGHSVADLLQELAHSQEVPQSLKDAGLELDKAYIPARVPNALQPVLPEPDIPGPKPKGCSPMPTGSSGSVRVFSPRYDRKGVIALLYTAS